jgi:hypothetical protein
MKKKLIFSAMPAVLLALGLALVGCPTGPDDNSVDLPANLRNTKWQEDGEYGYKSLEFKTNEILYQGNTSPKTLKVIDATENGKIVIEEEFFGEIEEEEFCSGYSISGDGNTLILTGGGDYSGQWIKLDGTWEAANGRVVVFTGNTFEYSGGATDYSGTFTISATEITFTVPGFGEVSATCRLSGNTLTISGHADSSVNGIYTRK